MKTKLAFAALLILTGAKPLLAQYVPGGYYGGPWYQGPWYSSTAYEGAMHGEADWIRSYGLFLESCARAEQTAAQTARIWQTNHYMYLSAIHERREMDKAARSQRLIQTAEYNQAQYPPIVRPAQAPVKDGNIKWPHLLFDDRYEGTRDRLKDLFAARANAESGKASAEIREEIETITGVVLDALWAQAGTVRAADYLEAKMFVLGLASEARLPPGRIEVASR